jgi:hypothetical protein
MKKICLLIAFCAGTTLAFAQKDKQEKVPEAVKQSFLQDHPNYNNTTWDMRNSHWHTMYRDKDKRFVNVYYDKQGNFIQSDSPWDPDDLPQAVKERMKKRYHVTDYNAYRIERPNRVFFQLSWSKHKVYMDKEGHEVKY